jgi:hypothetical protein
MPRYFTHYWKNSTWEQHAAQPARPLDHVAGSKLRGRVSPGDLIYIVTNLQGRLFLGGRMRVKLVVDQEEAQRQRRADLWEAPDHILGEAGTVFRGDLVVPDQTVAQLRFGDGAALVVADGKIDQQTLRTLRELTPESAKLLDAVLASGDDGSVFALAEEVVTTYVGAEGNAVRVLVNRFERDPVARNACIAHHGTRCSVCAADMEAIYGERGRGFIHVHHLKMLSTARGAREVDAIEDLRPVCPNCHAIIHRWNPPIAIEALREVVAARRTR